MVLVIAQQPLALHPRQLAAHGTAVHAQIVGQLLAVVGDVKAVLPGALDALGKVRHEPGAYIPGDGGSLHPELNSAITALAIVSDTTAAPIETVHGRVAFLQLVGLTQPELDAVARDPDALTGILERMRADDPELVLDMRRTRSYI